MTIVAPYLETESFPRGRRLLLAPVAGALLIGPYTAMFGRGPDSAITWVLTALAVVAGAGLLGIAIAQPRRTFTADGESQTLHVAQTAPLPRVALDRVERPFSAVTATSIEEEGTKRRPDHGFRPVITLASGERIVLRCQRESEQAQNVIDHLVLLGLPGQSRAALREAEFNAPPPTTWL